MQSARRGLDQAGLFESYLIVNDYERPWLRAEAGAGHLEDVEADGQLILANPGIDPISPRYNLPYLELARPLTKEHRIAEAHKENEAVPGAWKNTGPDLPQLAQARRELANLK